MCVMRIIKVRIRGNIYNTNTIVGFVFINLLTKCIPPKMSPSYVKINLTVSRLKCKQIFQCLFDGKHAPLNESTHNKKKSTGQSIVRFCAFSLPTCALNA